MQGRGSGPRRHSARFRAPSGAPAPLSPPHPRRGNKRYAARRSGRFAPPRAFCLVSVIRGGGPSRLFAHLASLSPRGLCPRWPSARARAARRMPPPASPPALRPALGALPFVALPRAVLSALSLRAALRASAGFLWSPLRGSARSLAPARGRRGPPASFGRRGFQPRGQARFARLFGLGPGAFGGYRPPCSAGAPLSLTEWG